MGRRKLEMKRIEDKNSRQVTFSKRRAGLNKKARHLSILCDVDVAVVVFSSRGKLYEYCSGSTDSVGLILSRYQQRCLEEAEVKTNQQGASQEDMVGINNPSTSTRFRTCKELLQWVQRVDEEPNEFSVNDMTELEEELNEALMHTRSRKTQLVMERVSTFHQQERELSQEKEELKQRLQVASAAAAGNQKQKQKDDDEVDDGGAGLQNFAANQQQQLRTLPLFKD